MFEELLAREHDAGVVHEAGEQVELLEREIEGRRPARESFAGGRRTSTSPNAHLRLRAAQHRLHTGDEAHAG